MTRYSVDGRLDPLKTDQHFGSSEPFSIGVEEELFLVDPLTGGQTNTSAAVLERLGSVEGKAEQELHACQVELITNIYTRASEAVQALGEMRRAVLQTGTGFSHPAPTPQRERPTPSSPTRSAMSTSTTCLVTPQSPRSQHCTSTSGCQTPRPPSARSTGCAASSRCCWRWRLTRRFGTAGTPA